MNCIQIKRKFSYNSKMKRPTDLLTNGKRLSIALTQGLDFNLEGMEEELTCPVCLELFADPLMLPCSHSMCKKCLIDILESKECRTVTNKDNGLECPSCRKSVDMTKDNLTDLPKNLALENIVIRYTEERSKSIRKSLSMESPVSDMLLSPITDPSELPEFPTASHQNCELCDGSSPQKAAWHCVQCKVSYCHSCFGKYHPRKGSLAHHKVRQPLGKEEDEIKVFCKDHSSEQATIFCEKCTQLVCHLCVCEGEGHHVGHTVLAPETAHQKIKLCLNSSQERASQLMAMLAEHKGRVDTLQAEITEFHEIACERVKQQCARMIADLTAALELQKERVLNNMAAAKLKSMRALENYSNENLRCTERLRDLSILCKNLAEETHQLAFLKRASEADPLSVQCEKLKQEADSAAQSFDGIIKDRGSHQELQSGVDQFTTAATQVLSALLTVESENYDAIIPHIKSPASAAKVDSHPRIQSKCLTTWGFSSTSFSGEALQGSCTWTVVVERNSGHWGNTNTGYLFGIGIASGIVGVKEQVGFAETSWGIVCSDGLITFTHNGQSERLMPAGSLPLSVMLSVTLDNPEYIILSYKLLHTTEGSSLTGKLVIIDKGLKKATLPVFTVSQRVKMLFPTCV